MVLKRTYNTSDMISTRSLSKKIINRYRVKRGIPAFGTPFVFLKMFGTDRALAGYNLYNLRVLLPAFHNNFFYNVHLHQAKPNRARSYRAADRMLIKIREQGSRISGRNFGEIPKREYHISPPLFSLAWQKINGSTQAQHGTQGPSAGNFTSIAGLPRYSGGRLNQAGGVRQVVTAFNEPVQESGANTPGMVRNAFGFTAGEIRLGGIWRPLPKGYKTNNVNEIQYYFNTVKNQINESKEIRVQETTTANQRYKWEEETVGGHRSEPIITEYEVNTIADKVYREIEKKFKMEIERKGINYR